MHLLQLVTVLVEPVVSSSVTVPVELDASSTVTVLDTTGTVTVLDATGTTSATSTITECSNCFHRVIRYV
jgi:hypothetical protein